MIFAKPGFKMIVLFNFPETLSPEILNGFYTVFRGQVICFFYQDMIRY